MDLTGLGLQSVNRWTKKLQFILMSHELLKGEILHIFCKLFFEQKGEKFACDYFHRDTTETDGLVFFRRCVKQLLFT